MPRCKRKTQIRDESPDPWEQQDREKSPQALKVEDKTYQSHQGLTAKNPANIQGRLNALKRIHMEVQKIQQETHIQRFLLEAEHHNAIAPLLQKRADIINDTYEPTETESIFKFREDEPTPEPEEPNEEKGIPKFWAQVLMNSANTAVLKEEDILEALKDVRVLYSKEPLGFTLHFDFAENQWFGNEVLTRSYELETDLPKEDLYLASGLLAKNTHATGVAWKNGKRRWGERNFYKRARKARTRQLIRTEVDTDSFFSLFVTVATVPDIKDAQKIYTKACDIRTRVLPRALLIFTEEDKQEYH